MNSDNIQPMGDGIGNAQQQEIRQSKEQQSSVAGLLSDQSGSLYDGSFLDPLQAHALQLTASAGLPNLLSTSSGNSSQTSQSHQPLHQQLPQTSQTEHLRRQQPTPQHSLPQHHDETNRLSLHYSQHFVFLTNIDEKIMQH